MTTERKLMRRFLRFHPWFESDICTLNPDNPEFDTRQAGGREALAKFLRWIVMDKRLAVVDEEGESPLFTHYEKKPVVGVEPSFKSEAFEDEEFSGP